MRSWASMCVQKLVNAKGLEAERELLTYLNDLVSTLTVMTTVKLLSGHADDEQYLDEPNDNFTVGTTLLVGRCKAKSSTAVRCRFTHHSENVWIKPGLHVGTAFNLSRRPPMPLLAEILLLHSPHLAAYVGGALCISHEQDNCHWPESVHLQAVWHSGQWELRFASSLFSISCALFDTSYYLNVFCLAATLQDPDAVQLNREFINKMKALEVKFLNRNADPNRWTRVRDQKAALQYTLMYPSSNAGVTMRGVPYSVSI